MTEKSELMHLIGNNVRKYRMERKLTQHQLADIVNCDNSAITRIESGTRMMSVTMLRAIAQALGVSCDALLFNDRSDVHVHNTSPCFKGKVPKVFLTRSELSNSFCKNTEKLDTNRQKCDIITTLTD